MPFGLANAPNCFQRYIKLVLKYLIHQNKASVYIDDCLIATETLDYNFNILNTTLGLFARNELMLRLDKCYFFFNELNYLG